MDSPFVSAIVPWPLDWAPVGFAACNGQQLAVNQYMALYSLIGVTYGGSANVNFNVPDLRGRTMVGMGLQVNPPGTNYQLGQFGGIETNTLVTNNLPSLPPHTHGATFTPTGGGSSGSATASGNVSLPFSTNANLTFSSPASLALSGTADVQVTTVSSGSASATPGPSNTTLGPTAFGSAKPYQPATTSNMMSLTPGAPLTGTASGTVSGTATGTVLGTASGTVSLPVSGSTGGITGGTVGIQGASAYSGSPQAFENRQPFLVLNFIIAVNGLYPPRP